MPSENVKYYEKFNVQIQRFTSKQSPKSICRIFPLSLSNIRLEGCLWWRSRRKNRVTDHYKKPKVNHSSSSLKWHLSSWTRTASDSSLVRDLQSQDEQNCFLTVHLSHYFCNYLSGVRNLLTLEDKQPIGPEPSVHFLGYEHLFSSLDTFFYLFHGFSFFQYRKM